MVNQPLAEFDFLPQWENEMDIRFCEIPCRILWQAPQIYQSVDTLILNPDAMVSSVLAVVIAKVSLPAYNDFAFKIHIIGRKYSELYQYDLTEQYKRIGKGVMPEYPIHSAATNIIQQETGYHQTINLRPFLGIMGEDLKFPYNYPILLQHLERGFNILEKSLLISPRPAVRQGIANIIKSEMKRFCQFTAPQYSQLEQRLSKT